MKTYMEKLLRIKLNVKLYNGSILKGENYNWIITI